jgi:DNA-binding transcriptional ArsR family regulator
VPLPSEARELERVAASFRGLAHPTRLRILEAVRDRGKLSPAQIVNSLGAQVALANVAHHTRELKDLGLLAAAGTRPVRGALEHFYRLSPHGRELLELADRVAASNHTPRRGRRRRRRAS